MASPPLASAPRYRPLPLPAPWAPCPAPACWPLPSPAPWPPVSSVPRVPSRPSSPPQVLGGPLVPSPGPAPAHRLGSPSPALSPVARLPGVFVPCPRVASAFPALLACASSRRSSTPFSFFGVHRFPVVERIRFGVSAALGACHGPVLLLPAACCCVARLCLLCHALSRAVPGFCLRAQPAWPWWLLRSSWSYGAPRAGGPRGFGCPAPPASPPGVPRRARPPTPSPPSRCSLRALTVPSPFAVARLACRRRWVGLLPVGGVRAGWLCLAAGWLVCLARGLALGCRSRVWPCVVLACRVSRPVLLPPCPGLGPARLWWALVLPV